VAPKTDAERTVAAIWGELLGIDRVGVEDSFFDLGGHSLLAIRVMAKVNEALRTDIPVARLYEGLTVSFVAGLAGTAAGVDADAEPDADEDRDQRRRERAQRLRDQQRRRVATRK
jgi:acyl carrier protein